MNALRRLFEISSTDPVEDRKRKLFFALLGFFDVAVVFGALATMISLALGYMPTEASGVFQLYVVAGSVLLFSFISLGLTQRWSVQLASWFFLSFITLAIAFGDTPKEIADGRTSYIFVVPILLAALVIRPSASFVFAALGSLAISAWSLSIAWPINPTTVAAFWLIASIAWLAARSLESAIDELRKLNLELDQHVTERTHELYDTLTREHALAERNKSIVHMVSHDLRNPVSRVSGFAEMLLSSKSSRMTDDERGMVQRILRASKQQEHLIADLLDEARIEAGTLSLHQTTFAPVRLLEDMCEVLQHKAEAKKLKLETTIAPDVPSELLGDPQRLHQILSNLMTNAIKFTDQGSVNVRVYRPDATRWALEVKDTGCGIPPGEQAKVFDPYRQLAGEARAQGIGLGLSIVRELVKVMEGEIALESEVGKGSTFTVVLPLVQ